MHFETSEELNKYVSDLTGGITILGFSTGKDSVAAWLELRKYFPKIVPVYMYLIPRLAFVEDSLKYYEDFFKTEIIRLPHPSLYRFLTHFIFQAPENCLIIEEMDLPNFEYDEVYQIVREDWHLPMNTHSASGVRARDSLTRWAAVKKYGALNENRKAFMPIFDFNKDRLVRTLISSGVRLPVDYELFGRSFDGLDARFLGPIKDRFPKDYQKIIEFFPLAEIELKRLEYRQEYYDAGGVEDGG